MNLWLTLVLAALALGLIALDAALWDSAGLIFAGRRLADLTEYLAFWR